jgi:hypothetical protein
MTAAPHDRRLKACLRQALRERGSLTTREAVALAYGPQQPFSRTRNRNTWRALRSMAVVIGRSDDDVPGRPLIWALKR